MQIFILLQCLDAITTMIFLRKGMAEGNPLIRWALNFAHAGWVGLVLTKTVAALVGRYCHRSGRVTLLRRANVGYMLVVGWNLLAIAATVLVP